MSICGVWMRALVALVVDGSTYEPGDVFQIDAYRAGDFQIRGMAETEPATEDVKPRRRRSAPA